MKKKIIILIIFYFFILLQSCITPPYPVLNEKRNLPGKFVDNDLQQDTLSAAYMPWKKIFHDSILTSLIDTAISKNQELKIFDYEVITAQNNIRLKKATYLPYLSIGINAALEKPGKYTFNGAVEDQLNIAHDEKFPEPLTDFMISSGFSWELDIWKKLRNSKKSAYYKYLKTIEGKNFLVSRLVCEIAILYYELMALDNLSELTQNNIEILKEALEIVSQEKAAAKTTELAVKRFEAELLKNQSRFFYINQQIILTENQLNFLLGRYNQPIQRNSNNFNNLNSLKIYTGIPSQLLRNRPDIRQAEFDILAAKMEVKSSRSEFFPSFKLDGRAGYNAYRPDLLLISPQSLIYDLIGEIITPVLNRNALKANYNIAIAEQNKSVYEFERRVLNAYLEVFNQIKNIENLENAYNFKSKQVDAMNQCIEISINLFKNARADYLEVLLVQREALEARMELIETKKQKLIAEINLYRALGGGWR